MGPLSTSTPTATPPKPLQNLIPPDEYDPTPHLTPVRDLKKYLAKRPFGSDVDPSLHLRHRTFSAGYVPDNDCWYFAQAAGVNSLSARLKKICSAPTVGLKVERLAQLKVRTGAVGVARERGLGGPSGGAAGGEGTVLPPLGVGFPSGGSKVPPGGVMRSGKVRQVPIAPNPAGVPVSASTAPAPTTTSTPLNTSTPTSPPTLPTRPTTFTPLPLDVSFLYSSGGSVSPDISFSSSSDPSGSSRKRTRTQEGSGDGGGGGEETRPPKQKKSDVTLKIGGMLGDENLGTLLETVIRASRNAGASVNIEI
ncbi:hypothetical protein HDV00_005645 [Rhizophlyctis rosea]|nr:hypothetical protein HDV00_005645 [Rhizophlyctis rosea]